MPVVEVQASLVEDKHPIRYLWLLQIDYAGRHYHDLHCAQSLFLSDARSHQLHRALDLLTTLIRLQVEGCSPLPLTRAGPEYTWHSASLMHDTDTWEHDSQLED